MILTVEMLQRWHGDSPYHLPEGADIKDNVCATQRSLSTCVSVNLYVVCAPEPLRLFLSYNTKNSKASFLILTSPGLRAVRPF